REGAVPAPRLDPPPRRTDHAASQRSDGLEVRGAGGRDQARGRAELRVADAPVHASRPARAWRADEPQVEGEAVALEHGRRDRTHAQDVLGQLFYRRAAR